MVIEKSRKNTLLSVWEPWLGLKAEWWLLPGGLRSPEYVGRGGVAGGWPGGGRGGAGGGGLHHVLVYIFRLLAHV